MRSALVWLHCLLPPILLFQPSGASVGILDDIRNQDLNFYALRLESGRETANGKLRLGHHGPAFYAGMRF